MRKKIKGSALTVCSAYFLSMVFAAPYFNWQYARDHGFASWIAFGEVIATAKSLAWPYYAFVGHSLKSGVYGRPDQHFVNSRRAASEALTIIDRFGGVSQLPAHEASDVARLAQTSVIEAELVADSYLKQIHPEFLGRFRDEYTRSLRDLGDGIRTEDRIKQASAAATYNRFSEWVTAHARDLNF